MTDPLLAEIGAAVELGRTDRPAARAALDALWERIGPDGDPQHRCALAHWAADLQDDPRDELVWDQRALAAGAGLPAFLPSLHLNLADVHRRLGDPATAHRHLADARAVVGDLPDDGYGRIVRGGIEHVTEALAQGSTKRLPSAP